MILKSTFLSFLLLLFWTINSYSQTYYNPRESIDVTITVKEPFKPINYAEISQNFNNEIQRVLAERNARKKYYQDIYYQTKSSINSNSVLTNEYEIDQLIFNLQENFNYRIDAIYSQLTSGGAAAWFESCVHGCIVACWARLSSKRPTCSDATV